jgi:pimeloyl-ACP methyl ester carboxylesterase
VFVHGSMDHSSTFVRAGRFLTEHRVLRYDRRGYGRSLAAGVTDMAGHGDDLVEILRGLGRPAVAVGHSLGGDIVLSAATRRPDLVAALVIFEAPMAWEAWWPSHSAGNAALRGHDGDTGDAAERFLRRMLGDDRWDAMSSVVQARRRAEGAALVAEMRSVRSTPPYDPTRVTAPLVVGCGAESRVHHRQAAHALAERVPGATLVEIPGAGHGAHNSHPAEFAALVRRGLASVA